MKTEKLSCNALIAGFALLACDGLAPSLNPSFRAKCCNRGFITKPKSGTFFVTSRSSSCTHALSDDKTENSSDPDSYPVIIRGGEGDEIDDAIWENIETGQPPQWMVMKEVRL